MRATRAGCINGPMTIPKPRWTVDARCDLVDWQNRAIPVFQTSQVPNPSGTVLLLHGRNGAPDQPQICEIATAYIARSWRLVAPALPFSSANPDSGPPEGITLSGHSHAALAVWTWLAERWPAELRALAGHSIGAFAAAFLAAASRDAHHALAVSPALSGTHLLEARRRMGREAVTQLEKEAPRYRAEMEAGDATRSLGATRAPVAVVTGAEDRLVPLPHARAYFAAARDARFFAALPGQHHCPTGVDCQHMFVAALTALGA